MQSWETSLLGRTGLRVGRLGLAAGYGRNLTVPMIERAFERGMNYMYWGSIRWGNYGRALEALKPKRVGMVLVLQSYSRLASLVSWSLERALRRIRFDYADVLLLGLWNSGPPQHILDAARRARERGLVRAIAVSSHNRPLLAQLANDRDIGVMHVRYNAAHTGAEQDLFSKLPSNGDRPGVVAFTATRWGQLMDKRRTPKGERVPTAADCYRFALSNPAVNVCICGPKDDQEAEAAFEALRLGPMTAEELAWMRRVGAAVHG
jgi:aryl-alcohol dehydrogenase-like predicted oxidoreductase